MDLHTGSRGGCKNPYGGHINPARIDFIADLFGQDCLDSAKQSGPKLLALTIIAHAAAEYLYFGLGRNGYQCPDLFFAASEFFFRTRSDQPNTWEDAPPIISIYVDDNGERQRHVIDPSPETLQQQCFDRCYEVAGLTSRISMDEFLIALKNTRRTLLLKAREQTREYLEFRRKHKLPVSRGQLQFALESEDFIEVLVCPKSPEQLEEIIRPERPLPESAYNRYRIRSRRSRRLKKAKPPVVPVEGQQEFELTDAA